MHMAFFTLFIFSACGPSDWSLREWDQIAEREFKIDCIQIFALTSSMGPVSIDDIAKNLPYKQINTILENKLKIKIDTSDLEKDMSNGLQRSGSYTERLHWNGRVGTWYKNKGNKNPIRFVFFYKSDESNGYQKEEMSKFEYKLQICSMKPGAAKLSPDRCGLRLHSSLELKDTLKETLNQMPSSISEKLKIIK